MGEMPGNRGLTLSQVPVFRWRTTRCFENKVNIVGEILGATDFDKPKLLCKYNFLTGNDKWAKLDGAFNGQTQLSQTDETLVLWNHPIDLHYATTTLSGWPKLVVEVWQEDEYGRNELGT